LLAFEDNKQIQASLLIEKDKLTFADSGIIAKIKMSKQIRESLLAFEENKQIQASLLIE
jgi:hypothetical protein